MDLPLNEIAQEIAKLEAAGARLQDLARDFPAVERNAVRILACVKMLKLNIPDLRVGAQRRAL